MWRAIETECAARRVTLKKFVLDIVEGHLREIGGWKAVGCVPRFSRNRMIWFADADMETMRRHAAELHVKWSEMVFACVLRWYESRTRYDPSKPAVPKREMPPGCLDHFVPMIREFYAFWRDAGGEQGLPSLATLRSRGLAKFADRFLIAEVLTRKPLDLVYIEAGRLEVTTRGENPVGQKIASGFVGDSLANVLGNYQMVVETGRPICIAEFLGDDVFLEDDGSIYVPCSDNGSDVSHVIVFSAYREPPKSDA